MKRFGEIHKKNKKARKAYFSQFRNTWGNIDPVSKVISIFYLEMNDGKLKKTG